MEKTLQLEPWLDLNPIVGDAEEWRICIGPDLQAYISIPLSDPETTADDGADEGDRRSRVRQFRIVTPFGDIEIESALDFISDVQPLPEGLLVVRPWVSLWAPGDAFKNAEVYSPEGSLLHRFCIGDGVNHAQASPNGSVWAAYFDEGVFGNHGWDCTNPDSIPLGASGLVQWDTSGIRHYECAPPAGVESVDDCLALNVADDNDVWFYYYSAFVLVHLQAGKIDGLWEVPVQGTEAFAVDGPFALFFDAYDNDRRYPLYRLAPEGVVELVTGLTLQDESGDPLAAGHPNSNTTDSYGCTGRGGSLFITAKNKVYRVDIAWVLGELGIA